jgi:hypothetical protein
MTRSSVAAGWLLLPVWEKKQAVCPICDPKQKDPGCRIAGIGHEHYVSKRPRRALEAAAAWVKCPCEEHREAWLKVCIRFIRGNQETQKLWFPTPVSSRDELIEKPLHCARLTSKAEVREAICKNLIEWVVNA